MTVPGHEIAAGAADGDRLPVSHLAREQVIRTLKAAWTQGRLTEDEHAARAALASAARSQAELAALTADLPADLTLRPPKASDVRTGVCAILAAAGVIVAILVTSPDNALAFMAFLGAAATLIVAPVITVGLMIDVRHQKRAGGRLPPGPTT